MQSFFECLSSEKGLCSQNFIFVVTYKLAQEVRMLHYTLLERLASDRHSSLSAPFVSCEENEVVNMEPVAVYSTLYFLCDLWKGPISLNVTWDLAGKACQWQTLKLIYKLWIKLSVVDIAPGTIFSALYFLYNLLTGPNILKYYITLGCKGLTVTKPLAYWAHL